MKNEIITKYGYVYREIKKPPRWVINKAFYVGASGYYKGKKYRYYVDLNSIPTKGIHPDDAWKYVTVYRRKRGIKPQFKSIKQIEKDTLKISLIVILILYFLLIILF